MALEPLRPNKSPGRRCPRPRSHHLPRRPPRQRACGREGWGGMGDGGLRGALSALLTRGTSGQE
eukprot:1992090-Alexandrium_andersonii.AAC.1